MKFSVITTVHVWNDKRAQDLVRAIESVRLQTYDPLDFEHIIVNDGSTQKVVIPSYPFIRLFNKTHEERVIAYNYAFQKAIGDWFVFLDSDDELDKRYLEKVSYFIENNPHYKMFNFGCIFKHKDGIETKRAAFRLPKKEVGHEMFGGGNIVNGTFVFHRSIYEDLGGFPPAVIKNINCSEINYGGVRDLHMNTPYDFSAAAQLEFPELRKYFMVDHLNEPNKIIKELGNPWGQDFYLFYKYTRKYHSMPVDEYLYQVHPR